MERKQTIIFFLMVAALLITGQSIAFSFWEVHENNNRLVQKASLSGDENNNVIPAQLSSGNSNNTTFQVLPDPAPPTISDPNIRVEKVITGLEMPSSMAFLDNDDIIITQKDNGRVRLVSNGILQPQPILQVPVVNNSERGLLGVAIANITSSTMKTVFLYYTEPVGDQVNNRIYRYEWNGTGNLIGGQLILDLPGEPGPNHDGGKIAIGPDRMLYAVIGDLNRDGMLQNLRDGPLPDDTSVILRIDYNGNGIGNPLSAIGIDLSKYYAYGIRNSFGFDFDPLTGILWDVEDGPAEYDEINIVLPGFNSGWGRAMGPISRERITVEDLVHFEGSHYADPVFSWLRTPAVTDIEIFNSSSLGERYTYNMFVGDFNNGNLYFFPINSTRSTAYSRHLIRQFF